VCGFRQSAERLKKDFLCCSECGQRIGLPAPREELFLDPRERHMVEQEQDAAHQRTRFETALAWVRKYLDADDADFQAPTCFVSYAWGEPEQERWVERHLAMDLR